jgi:hypothetical protein
MSLRDKPDSDRRRNQDSYDGCPGDQTGHMRFGNPTALGFIPLNRWLFIPALTGFDTFLSHRNMQKIFPGCNERRHSLTFTKSSLFYFGKRTTELPMPGSNNWYLCKTAVNPGSALKMSLSDKICAKADQLRTEMAASPPLTMPYQGIT